MDQEEEEETHESDGSHREVLYRGYGDVRGQMNKDLVGWAGL